MSAAAPISTGVYEWHTVILPLGSTSYALVVVELNSVLVLSAPCVMGAPFYPSNILVRTLYGLRGFTISMNLYHLTSMVMPGEEVHNTSTINLYGLQHMVPRRVNTSIELSNIVINRNRVRLQTTRHTVSTTIQLNNLLRLRHRSHTSRLIELTLNTRRVSRQVNRGCIPSVNYNTPFNILRSIQINPSSRVHTPINRELDWNTLHLYSIITILSTPICTSCRGVNLLPNHPRLLLRSVLLTNMSSIYNRLTIPKSTINILNMKGMHSLCTICYLSKSTTVIHLTLPRTNNSRVLKRHLPRSRNNNGTHDSLVMNIVIQRARRPRTYPMGHFNTLTKNQRTKVNEKHGLFTTRYLLVSPISILLYVRVRRVRVTMVGTMSFTLYDPPNNLQVSKLVGRIIPYDQRTRYHSSELQLERDGLLQGDEKLRLRYQEGYVRTTTKPRTRERRRQCDCRRSPRHMRNSTLVQNILLHKVPATKENYILNRKLIS